MTSVSYLLGLLGNFFHQRGSHRLLCSWSMIWSTPLGEDPTLKRGTFAWARVLLSTSFVVDVKNRGGPPKSSILIGCSIINHPFWGTPIFGNTHFDTPLPSYHQIYFSDFSPETVSAETARGKKKAEFDRVTCTNHGQWMIPKLHVTQI